MSEPYIGEIKMFAGNFAPRGYALCNGQLLAISQNAALFSILGTTYGGDGRVTFGLPDYRGRAPVHQGTGPGLTNIDLGEQGGLESVTLNTTQMPAHVHSLMASSAEATSSSPLAGSFLGMATDKDLNPINIYTNSPGNTIPLNPQSSSVAGGSQPFGIRDPYLAVNFIIATEGLYPPRP